jgi:hypothetical protein
MLFGKRDNPALWIDNYCAIVPGTNYCFPNFIFPDKKPRRYVTVTFDITAPGNGGGNFQGYWMTSLDEVNWAQFGAEASISGALGLQVINLNNAYPILMLNMNVVLDGGGYSIFSAFVDGYPD